MLELFTFDRPWPHDTSGFSVRYVRERELDGVGLPSLRQEP
jgi:hypothetical protein